MKQFFAISSIRLQQAMSFLHQCARLARLNRLTGFFLTFLPAYWGLVAGWHDFAANNSNFTLQGSKGGLYFVIILLGALLARSAGCVLNDIADIEFDKKTARAINRPLACGTLTKKHAIYLVAFIAVLGLGLICFLPLNAAIVCLASLPLIAIYPYTKRFNPLPQLFLGAVFNLGLFVGYMCLNPVLQNKSLFLLYTAALCWTFIYDTIYATQDMEDDIKNGAFSSVITLGSKLYQVMYIVFAICLLCIFSFGVLNQYCEVYYLLAGAGWLVGLTCIVLVQFGKMSAFWFFELSTIFCIFIAVAITKAKSCFMLIL